MFRIPISDSPELYCQSLANGLPVERGSLLPRERELMEKTYVTGGWPVIKVPEDKFGVSGAVFGSILTGSAKTLEGLTSEGRSIIEIRMYLKCRLPYLNPLASLAECHLPYLKAKELVAAVEASFGSHSRVILGWFELSMGRDIVYRYLKAYDDPKPVKLETGYVII